MPEPAADDEPPARPLGRVLSSAQFWELMERWRVPDNVALDLLGYGGKIGRSGKRPRFRFITRQQRITGYLAELDAALTAAGQEPSWLHRKNRSAPFSGKAPLEVMVQGGPGGIAEVLRFVNRAVLRAALAR